MAVIQGLQGTFDKVAEEYDRWAPDYVPELYGDIFAYVPINAHSRALEVGMGTGQATGPILDTGCHVTAVELGENMAAVARRRYSGRSNLEVQVMPFEDYRCADNTYDLVYSARAFHWIPEELGYTRVLNMLKPGGAFARFANHPYYSPDEAEMHDAMQLVYADYMPYSKPGGEYSEENARQRAQVALRYGFADAEHHIYKRRRSYSAQDYIRLIATYSDHIALPEEVRARFYAGIEAAIERFGGTITLCDTLDLELARKPE